MGKKWPRTLRGRWVCLSCKGGGSEGKRGVGRRRKAGARERKFIPKKLSAFRGRPRDGLRPCYVLGNRAHPNVHPRNKISSRYKIFAMPLASAPVPPLVLPVPPSPSSSSSSPTRVQRATHVATRRRTHFGGCARRATQPYQPVDILAVQTQRSRGRREPCRLP